MRTKLLPGERKIRMGRALFAVVGLKRVLSAEPLKITKPEFNEAAKLEPLIYATIYNFLAGEHENVPLPAYDHEEAEKLFANAQRQDPLKNTQPFRGHPAGDDFNAAASAAYQWLVTKMPRRNRIRIALGPQPIPPSRAELLGWRRELETAGNPLWALRQLLQGTLLRDHIATLRAVWPDVLGVARTAATEAVDSLRTQNPKWAPTRTQARQLSVLIEQPDVPNEFVQALQELFKQEAQQRQEQAAETEADDVRTPTQKLEDK